MKKEYVDIILNAIIDSPYMESRIVQDFHIPETGEIIDHAVIVPCLEQFVFSLIKNAPSLVDIYGEAICKDLRGVKIKQIGTHFIVY